VGGFVGVAGRTRHFRYFSGVRIVLDDGVAVGTAQSSVDARGVLGGINRNAFSFVGGHSGLTVAGQATFILLQRLGQLYLGAGTGVCREAGGKKTGREKQDQKDEPEPSCRSCCASHSSPQAQSCH